jgi:hypothetical protein
MLCVVQLFMILYIAFMNFLIQLGFKATNSSKSNPQRSVPCRTNKHSSFKDSECITRWRLGLVPGRCKRLFHFRSIETGWPSRWSGGTRVTFFRGTAANAQNWQFTSFWCSSEEETDSTPSLIFLHGVNGGRSYLYIGDQLSENTVSHLRHQHKNKQICLTQYTFPIMYWCISYTRWWSNGTTATCRNVNKWTHIVQALFVWI